MFGFRSIQTSFWVGLEKSRPNPAQGTGQLLGLASRSSAERAPAPSRQARGVRGVASEAKGPTICGEAPGEAGRGEEFVSLCRVWRG